MKPKMISVTRVESKRNDAVDVDEDNMIADVASGMEIFLVLTMSLYEMFQTLEHRGPKSCSCAWLE